jgi:hypothetical protein
VEKRIEIIESEVEGSKKRRVEESDETLIQNCDQSQFIHSSIR